MRMRNVSRTPQTQLSSQVLFSLQAASHLRGGAWSCRKVFSLSCRTSRLQRRLLPFRWRRLQFCSMYRMLYTLWGSWLQLSLLHRSTRQLFSAYAGLGWQDIDFRFNIELRIALSCSWPTVNTAGLWSWLSTSPCYPVAPDLSLFILSLWVYCFWYLAALASLLRSPILCLVNVLLYQCIAFVLSLLVHRFKALLAPLFLLLNICRFCGRSQGEILQRGYQSQIQIPRATRGPAPASQSLIWLPVLLLLHKLGNQQSSMEYNAICWPLLMGYPFCGVPLSVVLLSLHCYEPHEAFQVRALQAPLHAHSRLPSAW